MLPAGNSKERELAIHKDRRLGPERLAQSSSGNPMCGTSPRPTQPNVAASWNSSMNTSTCTAGMALNTYRGNGFVQVERRWDTDP